MHPQTDSAGVIEQSGYLLYESLSTVSVPIKGDRLFQTQSSTSFSIGFDFGDEYVTYGVSEEREKKTGERTFVYEGHDYESYSGLLYSE